MGDQTRRAAVVVGLGAMGQRRLATLLAHPGWTVALAVDPSPRAHSVVPAGVPCSVGLDLAAFPSDLVIVATPPSEAVALTCQALAVGRAVLCEKPPAVSSRDFTRAVATQRESRAVLMIGFNHRLHASFRQARSALASGRLGAVLSIDGAYTKTTLAEPGAWRLSPERAGGGILMDQGVHLLDLCRTLVGDLKVRSAVLRGSRGSETDVVTELVSGQGAPVRIRSSAEDATPRFELTIRCEYGELQLDGLVTSSGRYAPERLLVSDKGPVPERFTWTTDDSFARELDLLTEALDTGVRGDHGLPEDALAALALVESIYSLGTWEAP